MHEVYLTAKELVGSLARLVRRRRKFLGDFGGLKVPPCYEAIFNKGGDDRSSYYKSRVAYNHVAIE